MFEVHVLHSKSVAKKKKKKEKKKKITLPKVLYENGFSEPCLFEKNCQGQKSEQVRITRTIMIYEQQDEVVNSLDQKRANAFYSSGKVARA